MIAWPPKGYRDLVARDPFLSMGGVKPAKVAMNGAKWAELSGLNTRVNLMARYAEDIPGNDVWGPFRMLNGVRVGDCDDFAVHKLNALMAAGWPRGALLLTVCHIRGVGYHCVLLVQCVDSAAACLDNKHDGIWTVDVGPHLGYTWISQEQPGNSSWWRSMKND